MNTAPTFAVLTPPGSAAVATIAVAGPNAWELVRANFRPAGPESLPASPATDRFWYGHFGGPPGDAVIVSVRPCGRDVCAELHCHGGLAVVRMIGEELQRRGAVRVSPLDLLIGTGLHPVIAAARELLASAPTLRTAAILLDQADGAIIRAFAAIDAALARRDLAQASKLVADLTASIALGRHLTLPWRVIVAGAPNVGKSSLVNALAGYQRSVVHPLPGTTRDVVATPVAIDGWPVELLDTAGQRETADQLEGQGIERARSASAGADLCLWLVDAAALPQWPKTDGANVQLVINKSDLPPAWETATAADAVAVSAKTGAGLPELCERVSRRLVPVPPPPGAAVPFTAGLADKVSLIEKVVLTGDIDTARTLLAEVLAPSQSADAVATNE
jgi:tRNA modification GTPase